MHEAYAQLQDYTDRGVVLTYWRDPTEPHELAFRTWFVRGHKFRFDWRDPHPYPPLRHLVTNFSICFDGHIARWWQDRPAKAEERESLGSAIAGATGISGGAACDVPNLLMPEVVSSFQYDDLKDLRYGAKVEAAGTTCHRLLGVHPLGGEYELLIGEQDLLLRKIISQNNGERRTEQIHNDIRTNGGFDSAIFCSAGTLLDAG